jgi:hypothetical protein
MRGGKARRIFRLKPPGVAAVKASKLAVDRLAQGTVAETKPAGRA